MVRTWPDDGSYERYVQEQQAQARLRWMRRYNRTQGLDFVEAYMACALWSETDELGQPFDKRFTREDMSAHCYDPMYDDCMKFMQENHSDLYDLNASDAGHNFWLNRNGHGEGFWSRGWGAVGARLSEASKAFGETYLYVGDGGTLYCQRA